MQFIGNQIFADRCIELCRVGVTGDPGIATARNDPVAASDTGGRDFEESAGSG